MQGAGRQLCAGLRGDAGRRFLTPDNVAALIRRCQLRHRRHRPGARKAALVAHCVAHGLPVLVCGGAGGKTDASRLTTNDLALTAHDALLSSCAPRCDASTRSRVATSFASPPSTAPSRRRARPQTARRARLQCRLRIGHAHDGEHGAAGGRVCAGFGGTLTPRQLLAESRVQLGSTVKSSMLTFSLFNTQAQCGRRCSEKADR